MDMGQQHRGKQLRASNRGCVSQAYLAYGGLKLRRGRRRDDPRGFDRMPGSLDNLDSIALDTEAGAGLGYALERLQDKSIQRLGPFARQLPVQLAVDLADISRAVDQIRTRFFDKDIPAERLGIRGEFTDDLLKDIFQHH